MNIHRTFDDGKGKKAPSLSGVGNLIFEDPNNAPPNLDTSTERRHSLLFDSLPGINPNFKQTELRPMRTRADTFSHSTSRPFALSNEVPISETQSNPSPIQRRPTVSGTEFRARAPPSHNRTHSLNINTGLTDNFGPSLLTNGWDRFGTGNHSPFSGLISPDSRDNRTPARISAVETVASAIEFLGIDDSNSNNLQLINDPFNVFSAPMPEQIRPMSHGRFRSNSSALVTSPKLGVAPLATRNRSFSIPEKETRAAFESLDIVGSEPMTTSRAISPAPLDVSSSETPSRSLWVGNLDSSIPQNEVLTIFTPFGPIESLRIIPERECAFINYVNVEDAIKAKSTLNGGQVGSCIVKIAYGKTDITTDISANQPSKSLWIGNIPATLEPADLEKVFGYFGAIESARVLSHKNCGFINFVRVEDAVEARKQMNGKEISGALVKIGFAKVPAGGSGAQPIYTPADMPTEWVDISTKNNISSPVWSSAQPTRSPSQREYANGVSGEDSYIFNISAMNPAECMLDNGILREFRKRIENPSASAAEISEIFNAVIHDAANVSADYIGNVVIQKLIEKGTEHQRFEIIRQISPYIASIGIHKNGTWAVQKILDTVQNPDHIQVLVESITPYTPGLLLDQYGNYVVQCCLRFPNNKNQFIFTAVAANMLKIGLARFGSRATRTCLESQYVSKSQIKLVETSILKNAFDLSCDQNGSLLMSWLLDSCTIPGRLLEVASIYKQNMVACSTHKIASAFVLKICLQKSELDAREILLKEIFTKNLVSILADPMNGTSLVRKILISMANTSEQHEYIKEMAMLITRFDIQKYPNIKRFLDEFSVSLANDNISR